LLFLSGAAIPHEQFPHWLDTLGSTLPLAQFVDPLVDLWTGKPLIQELGHALYLVVLAAGATTATAVLRRHRDY
jgi:ABC-type uncharacterized transport system permease subunit